MDLADNTQHFDIETSPSRTSTTSCYETNEKTEQRHEYFPTASTSDLGFGTGRCTLYSKTWTVLMTFNKLELSPYEPNRSQDDVQKPERKVLFNYQLSELLHYRVKESDLVLRFIKKERNHKWSLAKPLRITNFESLEVMQKWIEHLDSIKAEKKVPKSLTFVINPVSGKKQALKYFSKTVEPLLKMMDIASTIYVSRYRGHAIEIAQKLVAVDSDDDKSDGVVCMGGDGTVNEVLCGLSQLNSNCESEGSQVLERLPVKLGVIPCGTSNNLSFAVHGTGDKLTALLHILMGDEIALDMMVAKNQDGKLSGIAMTMIAYGFIADSIKESESMKEILGTFAYTISFMRSIIKMRKYPVELMLSVASPSEVTPRSSPSCGSNCDHCLSQSCTQNPETSEKIASSESAIFGIQIHNHSGVCKLAPRGASANAHLGDGCMDVLITRDITKNEAIAMLKDAGKKEGENLPFSYIDAVRVNQVSLKADKNVQSCWILDGEVIQESELTVNNFRQAVPFFGRGIEPIVLTKTKFSSHLKSLFSSNI